MRTKFITLLIVSLVLSYGNNLNSQNVKSSKNDELLSQLKATTTVFFIKNSKSTYAELIKKAVLSVWTITPLIFADIDSAAKYITDPNYSYFQIQGYTKSTRSGGGLQYSNTHFYLSLELLKEVNKKGKPVTIELSRIELYPNLEKIARRQSKKKYIDKGLFII